MTTLILNGQIELLQPLTISVPHEDARSKHVHLLPFFDATGTKQVLPCVPGHNIKGALRSKGGMPALAEVYGADPADPETWGVFSINQVYNAQTGGLVTKSKTKAEDLVKSRLNREQDIHNSVFGSMRLSMKGLLEVDFAKPDTELYANQNLRSQTYGVRRDPYRVEPGLLNRHSAPEIQAFVESLDDNKKLSDLRKREKGIEDKLKRLRGDKRKKGDEDDAVASEVRLLQEELDEIKAAKKLLQEGGADSIGRPLEPLEYIAAGVRLTHEMRLVNASDKEIGYFLRCLAHFSNDCRLGGKAGAGYGRVRFDYNIRIREGISTQEGGRLAIAPYEFDLDSTHPVIERARKAYEAAAKDRERNFRLDLGEKAA